ncbi:MAG: UDP-N-acetylmuramoyl-L-alanyl-D-glutamate--2,6-diaminopimelate ligase [Synergistaceae bacterium]|jgi:UDP-N-acetylmuramoyl-L-alanyl-D-glutamate--2,6-diaminopimelate ligase|nr:UDP-N-acetylmuramoyl-L-alanyl-D-glutamate--2,6-diaminopimelate ligase [Synergistaceae bacterium]MDD2349920.1 UDP-N-acetylmuramoyl-L-alanyl-D-glutamate--2,6-diaminopimelate ligase [Synergistaceae bacterium]MDD3672194.1 UDP-N-acetylmuramoyl-L-alanyl-D-glutamate--2,6-diaminopimelate ligase [Synergistaceae bacterium]MDD3962848.1 UDP-N-acetylmuramoyl-L-alanyl-D-glutamate--2,6-diaminopimelate ligase [Synergistaceae bacterium]MDD4704325.1 UDP-N-acetylmuramoyl-L-alanyl-D-glutamate--2,6-diaminopimela
MRLSSLVSLLEKGPLDVRIHSVSDPEHLLLTEVDNLVSDSRKVTKGSIFACVEGEHSDGHDFAQAALSSGAAALLCEHPLKNIDIPQLICPDVRRNMGRVASMLYNEPASGLKMIGITGTNGKTTSTFMTKSILENSGIKTGLLGTVWCDDGVLKEDAEHTTPEGSDLQAWLHRMVSNGCSTCIMEASSHAISQGRIDGVLYDRAGFTNLTVDHLNYHLDMESYFEAKNSLFKNYMRGDWRAAVNIDDPYGELLYRQLGRRCVGYSLINSGADFSACVKKASVEGMEVEISTPEKRNATETKLPLIGVYNVMNALQALSLCWTLGIGREAALEGLVKMRQVPGRLERYLIEKSGTCVIDFAHNPDGLDKILTALRTICEGKLTVVFGASGESDVSKRPLMGETASRIADRVIISSDNPKSEDPSAIAAEILEGAQKYAAECSVIIDRNEAVSFGLENLKSGDILLLAGKGPESYQILKEGPVPYSDKNAMDAWCRKIGKRYF